MASSDPPVLSGLPPEAWPSPEVHQKFHMDLSESENGNTCYNSLSTVVVEQFRIPFL